MRAGDGNWLATTDFFERIFRDSVQNAFIVMNTEGFIVDINDAFTKHFGYGKKDIAGKQSRILFTEEDQNKNLSERELVTVRQKGTALDNNYLVNKNGTITWVSGESFLVTDKNNHPMIVKIIQNIHDQKQLEYFLLRSNYLIENILHSIQDIIVVLDQEMRILKANTSFISLFRLSHSGLEGSILSDLVTENNYRTIDGIVNELLEGVSKLIEREVDLEISESKKGAFLIRASLIEINSPVQHAVLVTMHDITQEKLLDQQRENMIGFVAHELRNPLTNLFLFSELLKDEEDDRDARSQHLSKRDNNLKRLNNIVRDLYDMTRANAGQLQMKKSTFRFEEMIDEAIDTVKMIYPSHRIINEGQLDIMITADKHRLIQVLTNYLINAIKYSPEADSVLIRRHSEGSKAIISVTDFGRGISPDSLPYLFMRYYRTEKTTEGVGLGLYLSREIVKAHRGEVWVESEEGKGSTFYLSIPY